MPPNSRIDGAIVFVVDGVNADIFHQMLSDGELPMIKKYFVDRGLYAPRAVASTPSVTLANLTSLNTGKFPGHHGIVGINWFDRNRLIWRNYETIAQKNTLDADHTSATLYEQFPDRTTFSVFYQPHRNATKFIENWTSAGPIYYFGWFEWVDRLTIHRLNIVADVAKKRKEWPAITVCYLLAPDFRAYNNGVGSDYYREALKHSDRQIGRVLGDLKRAGTLDKLVIAIVSDHGHTPVKTHLATRKYLRQTLGLNLAEKRLWEETPFEKRLDYYSKFPAVIYGSGERYMAICLRKPLPQTKGKALYSPWPQRPSADDLRNYPTTEELSDWQAWKQVQGLSNPPTVRRTDLLKRLSLIKGVDVIAFVEQPGRVRVKNRNGEVEFRQSASGEAISCHVITGNDPLGYAAHLPAEALAGKAMSSRKWLAATWDTNYPDLPGQILSYFRSRRAGDIVLFADTGYDFQLTHQSGHGGVSPADMFTPLLLAGPGVPHRQATHVRTVDIVPTLLHLLGKPVVQGLDGENLLQP